MPLCQKWRKGWLKSRANQDFGYNTIDGQNSLMVEASRVNSTSNTPQKPTISYLVLVSFRNIADQKRHSVDILYALLSIDNEVKRSNRKLTRSHKLSYKNMLGIPHTS